MKKLKKMGKKLRFSLKTQHRGSLRLLKSAPKPLKKPVVIVVRKIRVSAFTLKKSYGELVSVEVFQVLAQIVVEEPRCQALQHIRIAVTSPFRIRYLIHVCIKQIIFF